MKKIALAATVATALAAGMAAPAEASADGKLGHRSLAKVLAADGTKFDHNWKDFDVLEKAVVTVLKAKPDSPVKILTQGHKRVTAFIPTDAAFRHLVTDLTGKKPHTERATFRALASIADVDTVETVLLYHVVPGATITSKQAVKADGVKLTTAQGGKITVNVRKNGIALKDADKNDANPELIARALDINKGNRQIAHGIDRVLRPLDL